MPTADVQMRIVDTSLDDNARKAAAKKADDILADYNVALPLDPLPDILDLEQEDRRSGLRQPDRGHVLEHRSVGCQAVASAQMPFVRPK